MATIYFCRAFSRTIRLISKLIATFVTASYKATKKVPVIIKHYAHRNKTVKVNAHMIKQEQTAYYNEIQRQKKQAEKEKFEKQLVLAVSRLQQVK